MKSLTTKKPAAAKKTVKQAAPKTTKTERRPEAQCCAKTSRTVAGCHD